VAIPDVLARVQKVWYFALDLTYPRRTCGQQRCLVVWKKAAGHVGLPAKGERRRPRLPLIRRVHAQG